MLSCVKFEYIHDVIGVVYVVSKDYWNKLSFFLLFSCVSCDLYFVWCVLNVGFSGIGLNFSLLKRKKKNDDSQVNRVSWVINLQG